MAVLKEGGEDAALGHILHDADRLEAHRLPSGVRAGDNQQPPCRGEGDVERHDFLSLAPERFEEDGVDGVVPFQLPAVGEGGHAGIDLGGIARLGVDKVEPPHNFRRDKHFRYRGAQPGGKFSENTGDFAALVHFQLPGAVVYLDDLGRLDEEGLA